MDQERKEAAQVSLYAIVLCLAPDSAQRFACDIPTTCCAVSSRTARQILGPLLFGGNRSVPNFSPSGKPSRPSASYNSPVSQIHPPKLGSTGISHSFQQPLWLCSTDSCCARTTCAAPRNWRRLPS